MKLKSKKKSTGSSLINYKCNLCGSRDQKLLFKIHKKEDEFSIVKCSCGLVFMNPRKDVSDMLDYYDQEYFDGEKEFSITTSAPHSREYRKAHRRFMEDFRRGRKRGTFLDIGCGMGLYVKIMKDMGWDSWGLDVSEYTVESCKKKLGLNVVKGELKDAAFPDKHFNVIYMREVIEHLPDPLDTFREIERILSNDGILGITTANVDSLVARLLGPRWNYYQAGHIHYFSLLTLSKMLNKAGLEIFDIGGEYMYGKDIQDIIKVHGSNAYRRILGYLLIKKISPFFYNKISKNVANLITPHTTFFVKKIT